jgi:hypothetical protein
MTCKDALESRSLFVEVISLKLKINLILNIYGVE